MGLFGQRRDTSVVQGCGQHGQLGPMVGVDTLGKMGLSASLFIFHLLFIVIGAEAWGLARRFTFFFFLCYSFEMKTPSPAFSPLRYVTATTKKEEEKIQKRKKR